MKLDIPQKVLNNINKLFKKTSYDIRAYVGNPGHFFGSDAVLTPDAMSAAGSLMALVPFKRLDGSVIMLNPKDKVVIGYDNGPTSAVLAKAFAEGLTSQGVDVYMIGVSSSGQVYQNQEQLSADGHCQITRSHVEVTTNGAKFGIGTQGIHTYLLGQMNDSAVNGIEARDVTKGTVEDKSVPARDLYFDKMKRVYGAYFAKRDNSKIAVNVFGGTGIQYIDLFKAIFGQNVAILGEKLDVNSGTLLADPTRKEMLDKVPHLQKLLDDGFRVHSFDLDADRGSVTEGKDALTLTGSGHYLGDDLAYILAYHKIKLALPALREKLKKMGVTDKNIAQIIDIASVIYIDPRYTSGVKYYVEKTLGGKTEFHRKGHSLWKETITANMSKMAALAGCGSIKDFVKSTGYRDLQIEASLHFFSTDTEDGIPRDDAVENIFLLEKVFDEMGISTLGKYFSAIPKRFITKEIRTTSVSNDAKDAVTAEILDKIRKIFQGKKGFSTVEFDGQIRVDWATGFIMYGMSNTSPKLTFMAEGETAEERNDALAFVMALHNEAKKRAKDNLPMDTDENPFFIKDKSYAMDKPDAITSSDPRAIRFMDNFGITL